VGQRMATHPQIDKLVFTGSIATGKRIMSTAADTLKRLTLELGGNDAGIVLPGTNIEPLLESLFWGCFINAGQTCAALKRLYVHADQYDDVVAKLAAFAARMPVGPGLEPQSLIGPLLNSAQLNKVIALVEDARTRGAKVVVGGQRSSGKGYFYPLTVVANATQDMPLVTEEQFGPVIPVVKYSTVDEAVGFANALDVGLGGSVWGNDTAQASEVASRLECGTAWVNQHGALHPLAPFGGVKSSGIGVEFNVEGLKEYTTVQVLNVAR
jgi:acyl-CoA reductase-like NAD-dependent aldehyde dehydrogenase